MPPALRTDKDKYHVLIALRNYPSFTEYPLAMQQEIVGVGWYAVFGSKRVILRQGHWPLNFYFILSGSVVINVLDEATGVSRTVVYLTRGESFGELGLLSRQRRQSTVIAREKLELLCISDKDYTRIFMAGGLQTLMNPNQSDFVRSLSFLEGWPMHLLQQSHKKCIFSYFKKGDVLIRDSNASDWIVIIKSGSCFVMKVLHRVKEENDDQSDIIQVASKRKKRRNSQKRNSVTLIENFEQRKKREEFEKFMNELSLQDKEANIDKLHGIVEENDDDGENNGSYLRQEDSGKADVNGRRRTSNSSDEKTDLVRKRKSSESSSLPTPEFFTFKDENEDEDDEDGEVSVNPIAGNAFWELERASAAKGNPNAPTGKKKTIMDDIVIDAYQEEDLKEPIWVSIRTLTRGSVFGLAELVFDSQPSFTVVSNGAECILLSKKFYLEHANAQVMNRLRRDAQRFPGQDDLQVGLETKLEWDDFKVTHMNQLLGEKAKAKQAEALSRY
ncbi:uncharacterized protein [Apostichopus japonicus]|uniref:uncharacterized protein n=1 Tax=Stichopus japonicus TaxID=307972 RepID=UPI003AB31903